MENKDILKKIKDQAINDSQINTSGVFSKLTDFQNIMLSDISLLELLWEGEDDNITGKTIEKLYLENIDHKQKEFIEYENLSFNGNEMLNMADKKNWQKYRPLVLGKLIRYGFSKYKILKKVSGTDGFDAFIIEDIDKNILVYFPCTNLIDINDYLYDSYPIMDSLPRITEIGNNKLSIAKKIYYSQQEQAKELLNNCLKGINNNIKVYVSGFSLGGSLAEASYLNCYNKYSNILKDIILFNPYHNRLSEKEAETIKKNLKLYVCEGDSVSTIFNYNEFKNVSKSIYIDYKNNVSTTIDEINHDKSLLNKVVNYLKNKYIDNYILKIKNIKKNNKIVKLSIGIILNTISKRLERLKKLELNTTKKIVSTIKNIQKIQSKLEKIGINIDKVYDIEFLANIHYIEYLFTSTHLTYTVDKYKQKSFDKYGNVKKIIKLENTLYEVSYPSFEKTSNNFFGSNVYKEMIKMLSKKEK